ncbi:MAG: hypothetical protein DSO07_07575 [Thermoproteota archaeon]|jgi:sirohydrochlorin cobaltochelatase|uniref:Sirohydrochlorin cobaltochelatase n=1 Tax=Candidatus Methanodesulfokora washburnensis TaxID=2478471 RepID=A0A429GFX1_9CREN|nr:CbiX/SirB N-terminal domain-containing protein [Candidatus Methanodesulfokores washburnensis]RSN72831.1 hypothetical protein D6D85_12350 [Candidatus Methanodesulfokores washburnensis]RZN63752.1 MAG: hypothetical protein EF810_00180 [Candidatus Methanodesulfokores washburnensis]TDA40886.1 MAG: hypothetical protein DSO07_07575 [Candidatus Korarchaeota archaeon]
MEDVVALLIYHGSTLDFQKENARKMTEALKKRNMFADVYYSFMNVNKPSIREALREIARKGHRKVVAIPVFLSEGAHTVHDIPKELGVQGREKEEIVDVDGIKLKVIYASTIGFDERIADILIERGREAVNKAENAKNRKEE